MSNKNSKILYDICFDLAIERKKVKAQQYSFFFVESMTFVHSLKLYIIRKTNLKVDKQFTSVFLYFKKNCILV